MFNPDMMANAAKMMQNMSPEDMQRMSQMAANMDPKVMESMMKNMGGPAAGLDSAGMSRAAEQLKHMTPDQLRAGMSQAETQLGGQKQYYCNAAEILKNEGNALIKGERYAEALEKYNKALENITSMNASDVSTLRTSLLNNSALCHLKQKSYKEALSASDEVLKLDPRNFKALFRRGQARSELGGLLEAFADVRQASEISPSDKAIAAELQRLRARVKEAGLKEEDAPAPAQPQHEVSAAWQSPATGGGASASSSSSRAPTFGNDRWQKAAELAEDPDMLKQATDVMSGMSAEDLQRMMGNTPLPPGMDAATMKAQMEHLQKNPDMMKAAMDSFKSMPEDERRKMLEMRCGGAAPDLQQQAARMTDLSARKPEEADMMQKVAQQMASDPNLSEQMSNMMKNMPPDQLQKMMEFSSKVAADGKMPAGMGMGAAGGLGGMDQTAAMSSMMNDPDMMKATEEMMKNMSPETLAAMAKASGVDLDEGKAKMVARFLPWLMRFMRWFGYLKQGWSALFSRKGRFVIAGIVVVVAVLQQMRE